MTQSAYSFTVRASDGVQFLFKRYLDINNVDEVAPTITTEFDAGSIDGNVVLVINDAFGIRWYYNGVIYRVPVSIGSDTVNFGLGY